jgi:PhzF family phenazine biosynthesis protein
MTTLHVVDAFTHRPFAGNPAAVCVLAAPRDESWMRHVAREMNLSETAFLHPIPGGYSLRWLTPVVEVQLCGHATLASAFTLWETGVLPADEFARFHTLSGWLTCRKLGDWIEMDFPAKVCEPCAVPAGLAESLGCEPVACGLNGMDYLVELPDERTLRALRPKTSALAELPVRGVIATSRSDSPRFDFVSRFFAPAAGVNEDPVTGSAHCALGPYWQRILGQDDFTAFQASERGGVVKLTVRGDRVLLRGQAVMMSKLELLH